MFHISGTGFLSAGSDANMSQDKGCIQQGPKTICVKAKTTGTETGAREATAKF